MAVPTSFKVIFQDLALPRIGARAALFWIVLCNGEVSLLGQSAIGKALLWCAFYRFLQSVAVEIARASDAGVSFL